MGGGSNGGGHDRRPNDGGSSPIPWCTSTIFIGAPHDRCLKGCHRRGNGGGPGHPTPYVLDHMSLGEAMGIAHQALSQVHRVPHHNGEDHAEERRCLQLWASMFKRLMVFERVVAWAR
jgi:hypothetical protein